MLLDTDRLGLTDCHVAAKYGTLDGLQKIWEWARESLTKEELKIDLLAQTTELPAGTWQQNVSQKTYHR